MDTLHKEKGLTVWANGNWLIQLRRGGIQLTRRGKGGVKDGQRALALAIDEIERKQNLAAVAKELGLDPERAIEGKGELTFGEFLTDVYEPWAKAELDVRTRRSRESTMWHLEEFFGATPLSRITADLVDQFKTKRLAEGVVYRSEEARLTRKHRPLSKAGLAEQLKVLRAILNFAVEREYLDRAPIIRLPKDKRSDPGSAKPIRYFTIEERARLLAWCGKNHALADFIRVDLLTGMRPDEIFHLRCRSVDFARNRIKVEEQRCPLCKADNNPGVWVPKVGVWRELEMNDQLRALMNRLCQGKAPEALVFENRHGAPFEQAFYKLLQRAGLARSGLSMYSLRHTFAADLATKGFSLEHIGALLGQRDPRSTKIYAHLMPGATDGIVQALSVPAPWGRESGPDAKVLRFVPREDPSAEDEHAAQ